MKKILLITDKIDENSNFIRALKTQYPIDLVGVISSAAYKLKISKYDLVVMGVRMPHYGTYSLEETADGQKTGLVFYEKEIKKLGIPTILWSRSNEFEEEITSENDSKLIFVQKELEEDHLLKAVIKFLR